MAYNGYFATASPCMKPSDQIFCYSPDTISSFTFTEGLTTHVPASV